MNTSSRFDALRGDIFGGVTAAVVALPLALAFGVASGLGPMAGLYGAIAVGFFAAVFGGTPAQVSGPTGPMTVVMAAVVTQYADRIETAFAIVILGGFIQMMFGLLRVGRYVSYTPYSVISGFMSGIGGIIILIQLQPLVGLASAPGGPLGAIKGLPQALGNINADAAIVGLLALLIMIFWPKRLRAFLPPPLAALVIGSVLALTVFTGAPVIGDVPTGLPSLHFPAIGIHDLTSVIQPAFVLALLGTIDSLLTSLVADTITRNYHDSNRELFGQGIGNMAAGLLGALPGAGATMRTVINVRAGGSTPISGALHALILLSLVLGLAPLTEKIPHAVLAGILIKVGWDIVDWGYLGRVRRAPRGKVVVMFITLGLTIFVDLITAVAVGLILAGFVTARWMEDEELKGISAMPSSDETLTEEERRILEEWQGKISLVALHGRFSYASARELTKRAAVWAAGYEVVILDMTHAAHLDPSAAMALDEVITAIQAQQVPCLVAGLTGDASDALESLGVLGKVAAEVRFESRSEAIRHAASILQAPSGE